MGGEFNIFHWLVVLAVILPQQEANPPCGDDTPPKCQQGWRVGCKYRRMEYGEVFDTNAGGYLVMEDSID